MVPIVAVAHAVLGSVQAGVSKSAMVTPGQLPVPVCHIAVLPWALVTDPLLQPRQATPHLQVGGRRVGSREFGLHGALGYPAVPYGQARGYQGGPIVADRPGQC
jgi:hypothetical protein